MTHSTERQFFPLLAKDVRIGMWLEWTRDGERFQEQVVWIARNINKHGLLLIETDQVPSSPGYPEARTVHWEYPETIMMVAAGRRPTL